jgi:hypothetical protein
MPAPLCRHGCRISGSGTEGSARRTEGKHGSCARRSQHVLTPAAYGDHGLQPCPRQSARCLRLAGRHMRTTCLSASRSRRLGSLPDPRSAGNKGRPRRPTLLRRTRQLPCSRPPTRSCATTEAAPGASVESPQQHSPYPYRTPAHHSPTTLVARKAQWADSVDILSMPSCFCSIRELGSCIPRNSRRDRYWRRL